MPRPAHVSTRKSKSRHPRPACGMTLRVPEDRHRSRGAVMQLRSSLTCKSAAAFELHSSRLWSPSAQAEKSRTLKGLDAFRMPCRRGEAHRLPKVARMYRRRPVKSRRTRPKNRGFRGFGRDRTGCETRARAEREQQNRIERDLGDRVAARGRSNNSPMCHGEDLGPAISRCSRLICNAAALRPSS